MQCVWSSRCSISWPLCTHASASTARQWSRSLESALELLGNSQTFGKVLCSSRVHTIVLCPSDVDRTHRCLVRRALALPMRWKTHVSSLPQCVWGQHRGVCDSGRHWLVVISFVARIFGLAWCDRCYGISVMAPYTFSYMHRVCAILWPKCGPRSGYPCWFPIGVETERHSL